MTRHTYRSAGRRHPSEVKPDTVSALTCSPQLCWCMSYVDLVRHFELSKGGKRAAFGVQFDCESEYIGKESELRK